MTDMRARYASPAAPSADGLRRRITRTAVVCALGVTAVSAAEMLIPVHPFSGPAMLPNLGILVVAGAVFLLVLLQSRRGRGSLEGALAVAALAVVAWWVVPALLAALIYAGFSQMAISGFLLILLISMIGSIRVLAGVVGAGVFVLVVRRGLDAQRRA